MGIYADGFAKMARMRHECNLQNICYNCKTSLRGKLVFCQKAYDTQPVEDTDKVCAKCAVELGINHRNCNINYAFRKRKDYKIRFYNHTAQEEQEFYVRTYSMLRAIKLWRKDYPRNNGHEYIKISNYVPPTFRTESRYLE